MASIPRYQPDQRIGQQGPRQEHSIDQATRKHEEMQVLGVALQKAAVASAQYNYQLQKAQDAQTDQTFKDAAEKRGQDINNAIRKGEGLNENADNAEDLYDSSFGDIYERASSLGPRQQRLAKAAIRRGMLKNRVKATQLGMIWQNAKMFEREEQSIKEGGEIIANDPSQYESKLQEQMDRINSMPFSEPNKKKIIKFAQENAAMSVLNHYKESHQYEQAEKEITEGAVSSAFSAEERNKQLDDIRTERRNYLNDIQASRRRQEDEEVRYRKEEKEARTLDIYKTMGRGDENSFQEARVKIEDAAANNLISQNEKKEMLKNLSWGGMQVKEISAATFNNFSTRLSKGEAISSFPSDVHRANSLSPGQKRDLLEQHQLMTQMDKYTGQSEYAKITKAKKFIEDAFPKDAKASPYLREARIAEATQNFFGIVSRGDKKSLDYTNSAMDAIQAVDPGNYVVSTYKQGGQVKAIEEEATKLKSEFNKLKAKGQLSQQDIDRINAIGKRKLELDGMKRVLMNGGKEQNGNK